ncbi:MAG: NAD(P)H-binding protein, partial [Candidatus Obscuribacterales bacterium]|nr:NAD(P)H-binding protein [Candidatus Obscuribacterales bacterium]
MTDKVILVDGATGYIGSHLAAALSRIQGLKVRCLVRAGAKREDIEFLESLSVEIIQTDIVSMTEASAESVFSSVDCLVHLIGSIAPGKHQSFEQLHGGLTAEMLRYCEDFFVRKVVLVTACGTRQDSPSAYHRSKWQAEKAVSDSGLEHA